ncbi:hypothetical protein AAF712_015715 [Marasmius tenuissimus]|uniref:Mitochondrial fission process protein 1 n=1 Tax=Marasmius tenuissimus TaxID=585030 RepID=A0ABR2Z7H9_9AGAR
MGRHSCIWRIMFISLWRRAYESYKAHRRGPTALKAANFSEPTRISLIAVQRATFQSIASMALPALTIHTAVKQAKKVFVNVKNPRVKVWGPTMTGLAIVPALPYIFDHPVEHVTDRVFGWIRERLANTKGQGGPMTHSATAESIPITPGRLDV